MINRKKNREKEVKFYDILYQMTLHPRISLLQENKIIYKGSKEKKCYDISYHDVTIKITKENKIHKDRGKTFQNEDKASWQFILIMNHYDNQNLLIWQS